MRGSIYYTLLQDGGQRILESETADILRSVSDTLPDPSEDAIVAIGNAISILRAIYDASTILDDDVAIDSTDVTQQIPSSGELVSSSHRVRVSCSSGSTPPDATAALATPQLLEGIKAVLMHHESTLVVHTLRYIGDARLLDARPLVRAGVFDLAVDLLRGAVVHGDDGMSAALGLLSRLSDAASAGFQPQRALEPTLAVTRRMMRAGGGATSVATATAGFAVLTECFRHPIPRSLHHVVAECFDAVVTCASEHADGAGFEELFAAACAMAAQLCRPELAAECMPCTWADTVREVLVAVVDRLDPSERTAVGHHRHTTMLVAALDLLCRAADLAASKELCVLVDAGVSYSTPPPEQTATLLDVLLTRLTTPVLRVAVSGGGSATLQTQETVAFEVFVGLSRYVHPIIR